MLDKVLKIDDTVEAEWVAGVWRKDLAELGEIPEEGFANINEEKLIEFLNSKIVFRKRDEEMETDRSFKQVIPYFTVVNQRGEIFSAVRKNKGSDVRSHGYRTIGFGGHLQRADIKGNMNEWLKRELEEELSIEDIRSIGFFGVINDDSETSNDIDKVHLGLFFEVWVRGEVKVLEKEKMEDGCFFDTNSLVEKAGEMETWSKIAFRNL